MAAPTYRSGTILSTFPSATNTITITEPAGAASGDILIASCYVEGNVTFTPPTGWSDNFGAGALARVHVTAEDFAAQVFWIRRGGSAPSLTFTCDSSAHYPQVNAVAYSGAVASGTPFSFATTASRDNTSSTSFPTVSGTTTTADEVLVWFGQQFNGGNLSVGASGFTARNAPTDYDIWSADKTQAVAGGTGSVTGLTMSVAGAAIVQMVGLQSVAAGGAASDVLRRRKSRQNPVLWRKAA